MNSEDTEMIKMLFQYQHGFLISKIMFTAAELGVFDLLRESEEPLTSSAIAECLGTSHVGMERLLEACVGLKFLRMERKDNIGLYGNTVLADLYLAKSSPKSQYYYMKLQSDVYYPGLQYLSDAVREGKSQIKSKHGPSVNDFFQLVYRSEEGKQVYFNAMDNSWSLFGSELISEFDLSDFHLVCDLGGGSVFFAKEHISSYPNSTVTIFDLPEVIETAKKNFLGSEECRILFQEGDFLKDPVPEADLYILSRILHLWNDERSVQLLTKLHKACKPESKDVTISATHVDNFGLWGISGGGVLIVEPVLDDERGESFGAHFASIKLLLYNDGKTRTSSEHKALLGVAGFKDIQAKNKGLFGAILGRKQ